MKVASHNEPGNDYGHCGIDHRNCGGQKNKGDQKYG
jgi:hypothetical protein